jgi:hypothetical protein
MKNVLFTLAYRHKDEAIDHGVIDKEVDDEGKDKGRGAEGKDQAPEAVTDLDEESVGDKGEEGKDEVPERVADQGKAPMIDKDKGGVMDKGKKKAVPSPLPYTKVLALFASQSAKSSSSFPNFCFGGEQPMGDHST